MDKSDVGPLDPNSLAYIIISISVGLASFMQVLDVTVVMVALSHIQGALAATRDQMVWVLTSYLVATAIMIPLTGWLATRYGEKLVFLASIASFVVSSTLCGLSTDLPELVFFRFLQGLAGAALFPLAQTVLIRINNKENYGKAMIIWGLSATLGPALGPVIGGWITYSYSWHWIFFINIPIGILAFIGIYLFLKESILVKSHFDFLGFISLSIALCSLQLILDRGQLKDWFGSTEIITETIIACVAFYVFMVHFYYCPEPILNKRIFKDKYLMICTFLSTGLCFIYYSALTLISQMVQDPLNDSILTAGDTMVSRGLGTFFGMLFLKKLEVYLDMSWVIVIGILLMAITFGDMRLFNLQTTISEINITGFFQGIGYAMAFVAASTLAFKTIDDSLHAISASFFNLMRNVGCSIGISVVSTLLTRGTQVEHHTLGEHLMVYNHEANPAYLAHHLDINTTAGLVQLNQVVTENSLMVAYINDYDLLWILTLFLTPCVFLLLERKK